MIKSKMVQITRLFTVCFAVLIVISLAMPAYAEVNSLETDKTLYKKNTDTTMTFTGTADEEDINEIVTIVIYDPGNNFIKPAHSGIVSNEKTFEIKISEKDFSKISSHGTYNATAFMIDQQRTEGVSIMFDYSVDGSPIHSTTTQSAPTPQPTQTPTTSPTTTTQQPEDDSGGKSIQEKIQARIEAEKKQGSQTTDSTDSEKSIEEKIKERIEAAKKQQESETSPPVTTGSTGGVKQTGNTTTTSEEKPDVTNEKPDTTGVNVPFNLDSSVLYVAIGLGSAAAVVAAVYGMKYKPKHMARDYSDDTSAEQIQHSDSQTTHEEDYALMILKNRLAKGEITVEEFNELKRALKES